MYTFFARSVLVKFIIWFVSGSVLNWEDLATHLPSHLIIHQPLLLLTHLILSKQLPTYLPKRIIYPSLYTICVSEIHRLISCKIFFVIGNTCPLTFHFTSMHTERCAIPKPLGTMSFIQSVLVKFILLAHVRFCILLGTHNAPLRILSLGYITYANTMGSPLVYTLVFSSQHNLY